MIQKTTNYDQFKVLEGNRNLNRAHLAHLTLSIAKKNLMQYSPILVNENMEVIDGQHRLEVARQNKWPVYYVIIPNSNLDDVMELNTNVRTWKLNDFMDSLIIKGNKTMIYLREFCEQYSLAPSVAMLMHSNSRVGESKSRYVSLQRLSYTEEQKEKAIRAADLYWDIKQYTNKHGALPNALIHACRKIVDEKNDIKVSEAIKNRGKIVSLSLDTDEMYKILMSYLGK